MKNIYTYLFLAFMMGPTTAHSQNLDDKYLDKVSSLDGTLNTLYSVISGDAGEKRNWELFKYLFRTDAKLIPIGRNNNGLPSANYMTPDEYVERAGAWLEQNGFFEKEIHRKEDSFGNMTHVFSTYVSYRTSQDKDPYARGINSIQLLNDGRRWWVVNIYWFAENEDYPIPLKYLPKYFWVNNLNF